MDMEQPQERFPRILLDEKPNFFEAWSDKERELNEKLASLKVKPGTSTFTAPRYNFSYVGGLVEHPGECNLEDIKEVCRLLDEVLTVYGNYTQGGDRLFEKHELLRNEWQRLRDFLGGVEFATKSKENTDS